MITNRRVEENRPKIANFELCKLESCRGKQIDIRESAKAIGGKKSRKLVDGRFVREGMGAGGGGTQGWFHCRLVHIHLTSPDSIFKYLPSTLEN